MRRSDSVLLKVFLYGLPLVGIFGAYGYLYKSEVVSHAPVYFRFLNVFTGIVFAVWMMFSIYLSIRLMLSGPFRDHVLVKLTFIRERDEREAILTGKATRTTFLTSLAILIFLFFLSCFQVSVYRVPPERAVDGKTGFVTLGFGFCLIEASKQDRSEGVMQKKDIFSYKGLPVSSTAVILVLILWQIVSYNYLMRRLMK